MVTSSGTFLAPLPDANGSSQFDDSRGREDENAATLAKRMDMVEPKLSTLEALPEKMTALESQFLQLRDEMRAEFSATRNAIHESDDELRTRIDELTTTVRAGDQESQRLARILHEDLVSRIATIQEGLNGPKRRKP